MDTILIKEHGQVILVMNEGTTDSDLFTVVAPVGAQEESPEDAGKSCEPRPTA